MEDFRDRDRDLQKRVACSNCAALCCRQGVVIELTDAEADFMRTSGTKLSEPERQTPRRPRLLRMLGGAARLPYRLESDCANLTPDPDTGQMLCSAYTDERRPKACDEFPEGGYYCRLMRVKGGVDQPEEMEAWVERSQNS